MKLFLYIALCGALGAVARAWVCASFAGGLFPMGTLIVNVCGSLLLGLLTGVTISSDLLPDIYKIPVATGFLGSLTTFSTFAVESLQLMEKNEWKLALFNLSIHLFLGLLCAALGLFLGRLPFR